MTRLNGYFLRNQYYRLEVQSSKYIVRAEIYPIERSVGSFKCGKKRCEVCENVNKTENFIYSVTFIS